MTDNSANQTAQQPWVEPRIDTLDVDDTRVFSGAGADGGNYASSQRS